MAKIKYSDDPIGAKHLAVIKQANEIIAEYLRAGFDLTLRQLYYQFVARGLMENKQQNYKRLGVIIGKGRLGGLVDWNSITDRTRYVRTRSAWSSPIDIINSCASQFHVNYWSDQSQRAEVWIEKDALIGVIEGVCQKWDVAHFSCRGYASLSELWSAAQRIKGYRRPTTIIHLGDHDPSGIDMTRDIEERLHIFGATNATIKRIALNMDQIEEHNPPPNPAKETDSRFASYAALHGDESWELDALDPRVLENLIETELRQLVDRDAFLDRVRVELLHRAELGAIGSDYDDVIERVSDTVGITPEDVDASQWFNEEA